VRIATWNCYRGGCLERAATLAPLAPDVAVIQECARPHDAVPRGRVAWFGTNPKHGVGVVVQPPFEVTAGPIDPAFDHSAFPAIVTGPRSFHLLAVWALPRPTYVRALLAALDTYADFLSSAPSIVIGDFNCFAQWSGKAPSERHVELRRRLTDDFRLVSAYHAAPDYRADAGETPTYFFRWQKTRPFHIDYCFVPAAWQQSIRSIHIARFAERRWRSDHRPVVVDVDDPGRCVE